MSVTIDEDIEVLKCSVDEEKFVLESDRGKANDIPNRP